MFFNLIFLKQLLNQMVQINLCETTLKGRVSDSWTTLFESWSDTTNV